MIVPVERDDARPEPPGRGDPGCRGILRDDGERPAVAPRRERAEQRQARLVETEHEVDAARPAHGEPVEPAAEQRGDRAEGADREDRDHRQARRLQRGRHARRAAGLDAERPRLVVAEEQGGRADERGGDGRLAAAVAGAVGGEAEQHDDHDADAGRRHREAQPSPPRMDAPRDRGEDRGGGVHGEGDQRGRVGPGREPGRRDGHDGGDGHRPEQEHGRGQRREGEQDHEPASPDSATSPRRQPRSAGGSPGK